MEDDTIESTIVHPTESQTGEENHLADQTSATATATVEMIPGNLGRAKSGSIGQLTEVSWSVKRR
jgi:hypothetical protein